MNYINNMAHAEYKCNSCIITIFFITCACLYNNCGHVFITHSYTCVLFIITTVVATIVVVVTYKLLNCYKLLNVDLTYSVIIANLSHNICCT